MLLNKSAISSLLVVCMIAISALTSCLKPKLDQNWAGPYKEPVRSAIKFASLYPVPRQGASGDFVKFKMTGLDSLKMIIKNDPTSVAFQFNGTNAIIDSINMADSTIRVIVPENTSSGAATLTISDKIYFGPEFKIIGNLWIDSSFNRTNMVDEFGNIALGGTNDVIKELHYNESRQTLFVMGNFTQWNDSTTYNIASSNESTYSYIIEINAGNGTSRQDFIKLGGPNGFVRGIIPLTSFPGYLIYGSFDRYMWNGIWDGPKNMTRIYRNGTWDFITKEVYNPDPTSTRNIDTLPAFLGGASAAPLRMFLDERGRLISIGDFSFHRYNLLNDATFSFLPFQSTLAPQVMAQYQNGKVDNSYGSIGSTVNPFNGVINDAVQIRGSGSPFGKIIIAGTFNRGIVMLDDNGQADGSFAALVNGKVTRITYNSTTRKILITGTFTNVNGMPTPSGIAMLNENGTLDESFTVGNIRPSTDVRGQLVTYAGQLSNGNVIVSGNFASYVEPGSTSPITRRGFMILAPDGRLASNLNNTGLFRGDIYDIHEHMIGTARPYVVIAGSIAVFDNVPVKNIVRLGMFSR